MKPRPAAPSRALIAGLALLIFGFTLALRTWDVTTRFWLLGDQIRDWQIALGSFKDLPLVGPATHVGGYTIGPAFYWILWAIRIALGPWFENLPHAGGIGQAVIQSFADALLFVAIRRRTDSVLIALTTIVLVATAGYDLSLGGLIWNPVLGSTLAKIAMALMLLDWHRRSVAHAVIAAVVAWAAVHSYTGAIYVTVSVFAAMVLDPLLIRDGTKVKRNALAILAVVVVLQLPYVAHQVSTRFRQGAMGAVTGSVARIVTGQARPEFEKSRDGYVAAIDFIQARPWHVPARVLWWVLIAAAVVVGIRWWRDPALLLMTLLPGALAVVGYALFLAPLDHYYYLSLMPAAVFTLVLALTAIPIARVSRGVAVAALAVALVIVPWRYQFSTTLHRMPEYGVLVSASRQIVKRGEAMRAIRTGFTLPPTADPEFLYRILGGRIDPASPWVAEIAQTGSVAYVNVSGA